jgi:hypothetical protein
MYPIASYTHLVSDLRSLGGLSALSKEDKGDGEDQEEGNDGSLHGSHDAWLCRETIEGNRKVK